MKTFVLSALAALALSGPALAQPTTPKPPPAMRLFLSPSGEPFHASPAAPDPLKTWFDQADANHDGVIDRAEFRADAVRFFKLLDENHDGIIDGFEVSDYEAKIVPELSDEALGRVTGGPGPGGEAGGKPGGSGRGSGRHEGQGQAPAGSPDAHGAPRQSAIAQLIGEPEPVSGADFNFDSHITLDEWMRATDQRFDILDQAKTGKLTLDELRARFKTLAGPPPPR
jgi:Ca2+-binding EF-hand superfamily protein